MTDETTAAHRVRALIGGHLAGPDVAGDDDHLVDDLAADSLDTVEITMMIEEEFGVSISDDETEACPTVGDWVALVERKIAEKQGA